MTSFGELIDTSKSASPTGRRSWRSTSQAKGQVLSNLSPVSVFLLLSVLLLFAGCHARRFSAGTDGTHAEPGSIIVLPLQEAALRTRYAALLGMQPGELRDPRIYFYIDQWMGTPYLSGGTTHMGIDCSAFSQGLYREVDHIDLPRTSVQQGGVIREKSVTDLQEGDLVFFSSGHNQIDHVGVYLGNHKFVHASTSKGVTISDLTQSWYQRNYIKGGSVQ